MGGLCSAPNKTVAITCIRSTRTEVRPRCSRLETSMLRIGLVGLGRMGQGMGGRLLSAGHELLGYNRTAGKAADLEKAGAKVASTVAAACKDRDLVISMVADDLALNEVALGTGGIRASLGSGAVHVAMGTHSAGLIQAIAAAHAEKGQAFVAAPVLGRPDAAAAGQLVIVAAGSPAAIKKCEPAFSAIGRKTVEAAATPAGNRREQELLRRRAAKAADAAMSS